MPATEQITLTLPKEAVERIRSKVASGEYSTESDYVASILTEDVDLPESNEPELEHWLKTTGVARYDAYDANPSDVYTVDEMRRALSERRRAASKAA